MAALGAGWAPTHRELGSLPRLRLPSQAYHLWFLEFGGSGPAMSLSVLTCCKMGDHLCHWVMVMSQRYGEKPAVSKVLTVSVNVK